MGALTLEQVRERIRRNFPKFPRESEAGSAAKRQKLLVWDRETATTIVTTCGTYRINRKFSEADGFEGYFLELCPTPTSAAKHVAGPFFMPRDARRAAQDHFDGIPLQADLT